MIVTKTPFRISLFGGGTDYPAWYKKHGGIVVSMTIPHFCYVMIRPMPTFSQCNYRVSYSITEETNVLDEIKHPTVREILRALNVDRLQIYHDSDLPARMGLGSSSAFTVGLLRAITQAQGLKGDWWTDEEVQRQLARKAIQIERDLVGDSVGDQDQLAATFGGLRQYEWKTDGSVTITKLNTLTTSRLIEHLALFPTSQSRSGTGSQVAKTYTFNEGQMTRIQMLAAEGAAAVRYGWPSIKQIGRLMTETWEAKRTISPDVTSAKIDDAYQRALGAGAYGGRLIGAGGGGYLLMVAAPTEHQKIGEAVGNGFIPVELESAGCRTILDEWTGPNLRWTEDHSDWTEDHSD